MRLLSLVALLALCPALPAAAPPRATTPQDPRTAAQRGLAFLARDSLAWKNERKCSSCHHAPLTLWALNEAKERGFAIDEKAVTELTTWVTAKGDPARAFPKRPAPPLKLVSFNPLMLGLGLQAGSAGPSNREAVEKITAVLLSDQDTDGSWHLTDGGREPMATTKEVFTLLTLLAILTAPEKEAKAASQRGLQWLATAPSSNHTQPTALRLLVGLRQNAPRADLQKLQDRLLGLQNPDGGWGQEKGMASDAYATGQALYALASAGASATDGPIQKGRAFLARTQRADGSWPMASRPAGKSRPSKDLVPITAAGSAWGVLGLVRSQPQVRGK